MYKKLPKECFINDKSQFEGIRLIKEDDMKIELKKWSFEDKESLIEICNAVDRKYLANRLPFPYTEDSADWAGAGQNDMPDSRCSLLWP